jgi:hypothetical protein
MISHEQFGRLRLAQFLPDTELTGLEDWEYDDRMWVGEALGFSEWLRPVEEPEVLRSLAINFPRFPASAVSRVLAAIDLPIRVGMNIDELRSLLGEPAETHRFADDRVSYEFRTAGPQPYKVSCTVLNEGGLSYLVVMAERPKKKRRRPAK